MSGEEDPILKQIKPCIEKMVLEITRQQPTNAVNYKNIILILFQAKFMIDWLQEFGGYTSTGLTIDEKKELESLRLQVKKYRERRCKRRVTMGR